jgi:beta-phosphoglucomutase-like phosphatase (HAD superfamily)
MPGRQDGWDPVGVRTMGERTFWWDRARPVSPDVYPVRAVIFDMDGTLTDLERDVHRVAYNAAFAAHGLDIVWDVDDYGRLLQIPDDLRRLAADLRGRGYGPSSIRLAADLHHTKTVLFDDLMQDGDVAPRPGLIDLVMSLFVAGVWIGVVSTGRRAWIDPMVRQLVGEGIVETVVTGDDVDTAKPDAEVRALALWEMGLAAENAVAVQSSARGLQASLDAGLATIVVTTDYTAGENFDGAAAVLPGYLLDPAGGKPLLAADCQRLHRRWWAQQKQSA